MKVKWKAVLAAVSAILVVGVTQAGPAMASGQPHFETNLPQTYTITGGEANLETAGSAAVQCQSVTSPGMGFSGYSDFVGKLMLKGCAIKILGKPFSCTSTGAEAGEVKTNELEFRLFYLSQTAHEAAVRIENGGIIASFQCGVEKVSIRGGLIAKVTPINTITVKYGLALHGAKGVQELTQYEGPSGEKKSAQPEECATTSAGECTGWVKASLNAAGFELHTATGTAING